MSELNRPGGLRADHVCVTQTHVQHWDDPGTSRCNTGQGKFLIYMHPMKPTKLSLFQRSTMHCHSNAVWLDSSSFTSVRPSPFSKFIHQNVHTCQNILPFFKTILHVCLLPLCIWIDICYNRLKTIMMNFSLLGSKPFFDFSRLPKSTKNYWTDKIG